MVKQRLKDIVETVARSQNIVKKPLKKMSSSVAKAGRYGLKSGKKVSSSVARAGRYGLRSGRRISHSVAKAGRYSINSSKKVSKSFAKAGKYSLISGKAISNSVIKAGKYSLKSGKKIRKAINPLPRIKKYKDISRPKIKRFIEYPFPHIQRYGKSSRLRIKKVIESLVKNPFDYSRKKNGSVPSKKSVSGGKQIEKIVSKEEAKMSEEKKYLIHSAEDQTDAEGTSEEDYMVIRQEAYKQEEDLHAYPIPKAYAAETKNPDTYAQGSVPKSNFTPEDNKFLYIMTKRLGKLKIFSKGPFSKVDQATARMKEIFLGKYK